MSGSTHSTPEAFSGRPGAGSTLTPALALHRSWCRDLSSEALRRGSGDRREATFSGSRADSSGCTTSQRRKAVRDRPGVATGRGKDFTAAVIIDLTDLNIVAERRGRSTPTAAAEQLRFLGRWYNTARIAIEMGGGFGEPVVIALGTASRGVGRTGMYRHVRTTGPASSKLYHLRVPGHDQTGRSSSPSSRSPFAGVAPAHPDADDPRVQDLRAPGHPPSPRAADGRTTIG
jgi:hypothetical protein